MPSEQIVPANLSNEDKAKAHEAAAQSFTSPGVQNALKIELAEFTEKTKKLTELFEDVERNLKDFDKMKLNVVDGKNVDLAPEWTGYKTKYRKMLWASRDLATEIATSTEQFATAILPMAIKFDPKKPMTPEVKASLAEIIAGVQFFIDSNTSNSQKAKEQADGFLTLKSEVDGFSAKFEKFGQGLQTANELEISELTTKLSQLKEELETANRNVIISGVALGLSILVTAILPFIPGVGWLCIGAGVAAIAGSTGALTYFEVQATKLRKEISESQERKQHLEDQNKQIIKIRKQLVQLGDTKVKEVAAGLESFEQIWNAVNSDCVAIKKYLEDVQKVSALSTPMPTIMIAYLRNANTLYIGLNKALKDYAVGIVNSGATKP